MPEEEREHHKGAASLLVQSLDSQKGLVLSNLGGHQASSPPLCLSHINQMF